MKGHTIQFKMHLKHQKYIQPIPIHHFSSFEDFLLYYISIQLSLETQIKCQQ